MQLIKQTLIFDIDTECLKIDLKEEQNREQCLLEEKREKSAKIQEIIPKVTLTDEEKYEFAEKYVWQNTRCFQNIGFYIVLHFVGIESKEMNILSVATMHKLC